MQIGRKIYYEKTTGSIALITGEMVGEVRQTTKEENFLFYPQLIGKNIDDYDFIQYEYGYRDDEFANMGGAKYDIANSMLIIYPRLTITADKLQIVSDGVDTATISSDYAESYSINGEGDYKVNPLLFSSNVAGQYTITAKSALHGENSLVVEVI